MSTVETRLPLEGEVAQNFEARPVAEDRSGLEASEKIRSLLPEKFRGLEYYLAQRYLLLVSESEMTQAEKSQIFSASILLMDKFDGKKRDSGVPASLHFFDAAIQLFGEYIPNALTVDKFTPSADVSIEHPNATPEGFTEYLADFFGLPNDSNFKILFNSVYSEEFKRLKESPGKNNIEAHLFILMHDLIEDDPDVRKNENYADTVRQEISSSFSEEVGWLVYEMSFLKSRHAQKSDYIFEIYRQLAERPVLLFGKARDLRSNILYLLALKGRTKDGVYKSSETRIKEKALEYRYYADILLEARDPGSELTADLLFFLTEPELFYDEYKKSKYFRAKSDLESEIIDERVASFLGEQFPNVKYRKEVPGVYRSYKRKNRDSKITNREAYATQYIINCDSSEELNRFVNAMRFHSFDSGKTQTYVTQSTQGNRNDFTEFYVKMGKGYSLLFTATSSTYDWIFSQFEKDLFGSSPSDLLNKKNLMERTYQYCKTFSGVIEDDIQRLIEETGRSLIKVTVNGLPLWLPEDSTALDVLIRNIQVYGIKLLNNIKYLIKNKAVLAITDEIYGEDVLTVAEVPSNSLENIYQLDMQELQDALTHKVFKTRSARKFVQGLIDQVNNTRKLD